MSGEPDRAAGEAGGTDAPSTPADPGVDTPRNEPSSGRFDADSAVEYLQWMGVAVLGLTALVALFGFYTGVSRIISVWVSSPYRPVVSAGFNLALLLVALAGIGVILRRLDRD